MKDKKYCTKHGLRHGQKYPSCMFVKNKKIEKINKKLGLPYGKMKTITICVDIDGTLRDNTEDKIVLVNEDIRTLVRILSKFKNVKIIVWSGSGELYAQQVARSIHITQYVNGYADKREHEMVKPDIAIDDIQDTAIGKINLIVREK